MNYLFISPSFPENYMYFCQRLQAAGVNVLGIGTEPYYNLKPGLKIALTEYYKVNDMENYDEMLRACGYFTHKYGKIDRIESHNEYWLELDAKLRTDFNVTGYNTDTVISVKRKSKMKKVFEKAGVKTARGKIINDLKDAISFIKETGYPVCAKPDIGVGAADTCKIKNEEDLKDFFINKKPVDYIFEEWIIGEIVSFDGITDQDGNIIFYGSFFLDTGVMDIVNEDLDVFYYILKEPDEELVKIGEKTVREFGFKERFFHIEYFLQDDGSYVGLEVNARPPGGMTVDMYNYAYDLDLYDLYAKMIAQKPYHIETKRNYYSAYIGRKTHKDYLHSNSEIQKEFDEMLVYYGPVSSIFANAMGDYCFILRSPNLGEIKKAANYMLKKFII